MSVTNLVVTRVKFIFSWVNSNWNYNSTTTAESFTTMKMYLYFSHNDLPWNIRKFIHNKLKTVNFTTDLRKVDPWSTSKWSHTDIPRLRKGMVGAQVSANYTFGNPKS